MKIHYDRDCPPALGEPVAVMKDSEHQIEKVGRELRAMMTWLEPVEK
jgi:hypothetical protein